MPEPTPRRFSLQDAMILVAATAVGLPLQRTFLQNTFYTLRVNSTAAWLGHMGSLGLIGFSGCATAWSMAVLILGLRPPRPRRTRLARKPGLMACAAATATAAVVAPLFVLWVVLERMVPGNPQMVFYFNLLVPAEIGCGVLGAWLVMAVGGRWRPEPSWSDRLGRALGLYWIATLFATYWLLID